MDMVLYSVQKLSDKSGIPPSTSRYWLVNLFKEFAPSRVSGKWPDEALDLIIQIKELKNQQLDNEDVREELRKTTPIDGEVPETKALTTRADQEFYQQNLHVLTQVVENQQKHLDLLERLLLEMLGKNAAKSKEGTTKKKATARKTTKKKAPPKKKPVKKPTKKRTYKKKPVKKTLWQRIRGK